jgi:hypothetical protein
MNYDLDTEEGMANAKAWTEAHLKTFKDGGLWVVPRSGGIYKIDYKKKEVTFFGLFQEPCITRVLKELGWTIKEK